MENPIILIIAVIITGLLYFEITASKRTKRRFKKNAIKIIRIFYMITKFIFGFLFTSTMKIIYRYKYNDIFLSNEEIANKLEQMTPRQFEIFIADLYRLQGYRVKLTKESADGGKDVILFDKYNNMYYVECKHFSKTNNVGREICQKLLGACYADKVPNAIIVTTGGFNNNAIAIAKKVDNLELIGIKGIVQMTRRVKNHKIGYILRSNY